MARVKKPQFTVDALLRVLRGMDPEAQVFVFSTGEVGSEPLKLVSSSLHHDLKSRQFGVPKLTAEAKREGHGKYHVLKGGKQVVILYP
mgnify:CR=1 FL=1